jgi:hypothetical protein
MNIHKIPQEGTNPKEIKNKGNDVTFYQDTSKK